MLEPLAVRAWGLISGTEGEIMSKNPMLAVGFAAVLALAGTAVQAQGTNTQSATSPSSAAPATQQKLNKADQHFLTEAIEGDLTCSSP